MDRRRHAFPDCGMEKRAKERERRKGEKEMEKRGKGDEKMARGKNIAVVSLNPR